MSAHHSSPVRSSFYRGAGTGSLETPFQPPVMPLLSGAPWARRVGILTWSAS